MESSGSFKISDKMKTLGFQLYDCSLSWTEALPPLTESFAQARRKAKQMLRRDVTMFKKAMAVRYEVI